MPKLICKGVFTYYVLDLEIREHTSTVLVFATDDPAMPDGGVLTDVPTELLAS